MGALRAIRSDDPEVAEKIGTEPDYTIDKESDAIRKHLAEGADLLGAIRLYLRQPLRWNTAAGFALIAGAAWVVFRW